MLIFSVQGVSMKHVVGPHTDKDNMNIECGCVDGQIFISAYPYDVKNSKSAQIDHFGKPCMFQSTWTEISSHLSPSPINIFSSVPFTQTITLFVNIIICIFSHMLYLLAWTSLPTLFVNII